MLRSLYKKDIERGLHLDIEMGCPWAEGSAHDATYRLPTFR
jgi:hypothetical protein